MINPSTFDLSTLPTEIAAQRERPILFSELDRWAKIAATRIGVSVKEYVSALNEGCKLCGGCGKKLARTLENYGKDSKTFDKLKSRCRSCIAIQKKEHYNRTFEQQKPSRLAYRLKNREQLYKSNREWGTKYRAKVRSEMIAAYGGECACCSESTPQFLQLDHIHGDGAEERRKENASGVAFHRRLQKRGWPKDRHQLLCANCNFGRLMNNGVCPHQGGKN